MARKARKPSDFMLGDVVFDADEDSTPKALGIVVELRPRGIKVVYEHGGRAAGGGLRFSISRHKPLTRVVVPNGAFAVRWWHRAQSVTAALRRAGLRNKEALR